MTIHLSHSIYKTTMLDHVYAYLQMNQLGFLLSDLNSVRVLPWWWICRKSYSLSSLWSARSSRRETDICPFLSLASGKGPEKDKPGVTGKLSKIQKGPSVPNRKTKVAFRLAGLSGPTSQFLNGSTSSQDWFWPEWSCIL